MTYVQKVPTIHNKNPVYETSSFNPLRAVQYIAVMMIDGHVGITRGFSF